MKADGAKAEQLKAIGAELLESNKQVMTLEKPWAPNMDHVTEELGHDTFAAHLAQLANLTGIPALDADTTVWQGNWLFPSVPGDVLTTDDGARLSQRSSSRMFQGRSRHAQQKRPPLH